MHKKTRSTLPCADLFTTTFPVLGWVVHSRSRSSGGRVAPLTDTRGPGSVAGDALVLQILLAFVPFGALIHPCIRSHMYYSVCELLAALDVLLMMCMCAASRALAAIDAH